MATDLLKELEKGNPWDDAQKKNPWATEPEKQPVSISPEPTISKPVTTAQLNTQPQRVAVPSYGERIGGSLADKMDGTDYDRKQNADTLFNPVNHIDIKRPINSLVKPNETPRDYAERTKPSDTEKAFNQLLYENLVQLDRTKAPTPAMLNQRRKQLRNEAIIAAVADGLSALGSLYFTTKGGVPVFKPENGLSRRAGAWYNQAKEQDERNAAKHMGLLQNVYSMLRGRDAEKAAAAHQQWEDAMKEESHNMSMQKVGAEIQKLMSEGKLDEAKELLERAKAEGAAIDNQYKPYLNEADLKVKDSTISKNKAQANQANAGAGYYNARAANERNKSTGLKNYSDKQLDRLARAYMANLDDKNKASIAANKSANPLAAKKVKIHKGDGIMGKSYTEVTDVDNPNLAALYAYGSDEMIADFESNYVKNHGTPDTYDSYRVDDKK